MTKFDDLISAKKHPFLPAAAVAVAVVSASGPSYAQDCFRVLGYEWIGDSQSLDPAQHNSTDDSVMLNAVYNRLVNLDGNFQVLPELATEWEPSDEGRTWVFTIRDGVEFHDGSALDASDVYFSFARLLDEALPTSAKDVLAFMTVENMEVLDDRHIQFTFDDPIAELPLLLANKFNFIVPEGATPEQLRTQGIGTGPFKASDFQPGQPVRRFVKNESYWRAGLPKSDCLEVTVAQEPVRAAAQIRSGDVDLSLQVTPALVPSLKDNSDVTLLSTAASNSMTISMFVDEPPFDDPRVREAMKLVIDRELVVNTVLAGFGEVGADSPIPLSSPDSHVDVAPARDIERAKALLEEAGHEGGLDVTLYTSEALPGMSQWAQLYAQMAAPAGINVTVNMTPADSYWDEVWLKQPLITSGWNRRPAGEALAYAYLSDSSLNETHFKSETYDALLSEAAKTVGDDARRKKYQEAGALLASEGGVIIPAFVHQVAAIRSNCSGYEPHVQAFNINYEDLTCAR